MKWVAIKIASEYCGIDLLSNIAVFVDETREKGYFTLCLLQFLLVLYIQEEHLMMP